jgi:hypothetical protein
MKAIVVGLAILAVSTSAALAAKKTHHAMKPKETAAAATPGAPNPNLVVPGGVSAADKALYAKNLHDSGMKK